MNLIRKILIDIASITGFVSGVIMTVLMDVCFLVAPKLYIKLSLFFIQWLDKDDEDN